jgi:hypothetical protein
MCGRRISFRRGKERHGADIDNTKKYQRKRTKAKRTNVRIKCCGLQMKAV